MRGRTTAAPGCAAVLVLAVVASRWELDGPHVGHGGGNPFRTAARVAEHRWVVWCPALRIVIDKISEDIDPTD